MLDHLNRVYGSRSHFNVWSTEYAYRTKPPDHVGVSLANQAYWLNWAEYISYKQKRISSFDQYLLVDPPSGSFASGLEFNNRKPKPSFDAYRMPLYLPTTSTRKGKSIEVWGAARPAHFAVGPAVGGDPVPQQFQEPLEVAQDGPDHQQARLLRHPHVVPVQRPGEAAWSGFLSRTQNIKVR